MENFYSIVLLPCAHVQGGKVIGRVVIVSTKIAIYRDLLLHLSDSYAS